MGLSKRVGKVTEAAMRRLGVTTIGQLRTIPIERLRQNFGDGGEHFWRLAQGIDHRPAVPDRQAKQLSHETTFARDLTEIEPLRHRLWELTDQVARRLRRSGRCGRTIQIKLRLSNFRTITRSRSLAQPSDITAELWQAARDLLDAALPPAVLAQLGTFGTTHCNASVCLTSALRDPTILYLAVTSALDSRRSGTIAGA